MSFDEMVKALVPTAASSGLPGTQEIIIGIAKLVVVIEKSSAESKLLANKMLFYARATFLMSCICVISTFSYLIFSVIIAMLKGK